MISVGKQEHFRLQCLNCEFENVRSAFMMKENI